MTGSADFCSNQFPFSVLMSVTTTVAPASARISAVLAPMPWPDPEIKATLLSTLLIDFSFVTEQESGLQHQARIERA